MIRTTVRTTVRTTDLTGRDAKRQSRLSELGELKPCSLLLE